MDSAHAIKMGSSVIVESRELTNRITEDERRRRGGLRGVCTCEDLYVADATLARQSTKERGRFFQNKRELEVTNKSAGRDDASHGQGCVISRYSDIFKEYKEKGGRAMRPRSEPK